MGQLSGRLGFRAISVEDPSQPLLPPTALLESLGLGRSDAGIVVNEEQAMRLTTAHACIKIPSEDLAAVPHEILQWMPDDSFRQSREHRLWRILHDEPNRNMTAKVFWGCVGACLLAWGNGYALIKRDGAARTTALIPLHPKKTAPISVNGRMMFATTQTDTGAAVQIDPANILHFINFTLDGITGISPVQACKNAFGLALAAEKFGAQFFGNGARATGVLSHPGSLDTEAYDNLKRSVQEWATGGAALRPIILEEGLKWEQITVNPDDAQFLVTRQFQRSEIAALYRVPMHLLQDLSRSTNNNIEHQSIDYTKFCLHPLAVGIEQEVNRKLLGGPFSMEHNLSDMRTGDFASRTAGFQTLRNIGVLSANNILRALRMNPIPKEEGGDLRTVQGAMISLESLLLGGGGDPTGQASGGAGSGGSSSGPADRLRPAFRGLLRDAVGRVTNRAERDGEFVRRAFRPVVIALAQAVYALRFGNTELTERDLRLVDAALADIAGWASAWERKDAAPIADRLVGSIAARFSGAELLLTAGE